MKNNSIKYSALFFLSLLLCIHFNKAHAADSINVNVSVDGTCNTNLICEPFLAEDTNSCPSDCIPPPPPVSTSTSSNRKSGSVVKMDTISVTSIISESNTISVYWKSSTPTNGRILWQKDYQDTLRFLQESGTTTEHYFVLPNLLPQTSYTITIIAEDARGQTFLKKFIASTRPPIESSPAVTNFKITNQGGGALLSWNNPDRDFSYVRIMKSELFFPTSPTDGELLYEGNSKSMLDTKIVDNKRYYYTIFTRRDTRYSSGVSQSFQKLGDNLDTTGYPVTIFGPIFDTKDVEPITKAPFEVVLYQNTNEIKIQDGKYLIQNDADFLVTIPKTDEIPDDALFFISYIDKNNDQIQDNFVLHFDEKTKTYTTNNLSVTDSDSQNFVIYMKTNEKILGYKGEIDVQKIASSQLTFWESIKVNFFEIIAYISVFLVLYGATYLVKILKR